MEAKVNEYHTFLYSQLGIRSFILIEFGLVELGLKLADLKDGISGADMVPAGD